MKKRTNLLVLAAVCLIFVLGWIIYDAGSSMAEYNDEIEYVIGVSQASMREAWRIALINEIEEEAKKYDNIRIITTDATSNVDKQQQDVDKLIKYGIDLLIISPCDTAKMTDKIKELYLNGTPVIVMDRGVEGFDYSLFIGPDNAMIGHQAGECVVSLLQENKGSVLELCGNASSIQSQERSEGFNSVIKNYPDIHREVRWLETEVKDKAYDTIKGMYKELLEIDIIFANSDYMALGAYEALKSLGMETKIKIVGSDGFAGKNEGLELVEQNKIAAAISCPTGGREAIQYAINILKQESGVPKQVILRSHLVNKNNVKEYVASLNRRCVDDGRTITVGYSQVGQESQWRLANTRSIQEAAESFNIRLLFDDANQSQEKQIAAIRHFIEEKVDVIVVSPVVENGWDQVLLEAKAAGIPVVMSDRKIEAGEDLTTTYIGADFLEEGRRAMRWLKDNVKTDKGNLNILEIQGNKGASPTEERRIGFAEIMKDYPEYRLIYTDYGDYTYEGGKRIIEEYLQKKEWDVDIIYSQNDDMALGAIEALEEHGINPGVDVKIVSVDGTKDAFQAMIEGKLNCAVECNPLLGEPLMKAVRDMAAGKIMPLRIITEEKVYDQTMAESELKSRAY